MMKIAFCFTLIALSFLRYLNFHFDFFDYVRKRLDKKAKFKIFDVIICKTNNCIERVVQYLKKEW